MSVHSFLGHFVLADVKVIEGYDMGWIFIFKTTHALFVGAAHDKGTAFHKNHIVSGQIGIGVVLFRAGGDEQEGGRSRKK